MDIKFHIGRKCNLRCEYCHVEKVTHSEPSYLSALDKVIDGIQDKSKISRILITGGEPTLYHDQVIQILEKYKDIKRINIPSNGTDVDKLIQYTLEYKNVVTSISWDGHINERGFDSFNSIKAMFEAGLKCNILYVISNKNYSNMFDDLMELNAIIPNIESFVELLFVMRPEAEYNMDFDILTDQLTKMYRKFPHLSIFKRDKNRKCPITYSDDYQIEIRDGIVYNGCINYSFGKTTAMYKLGDCVSTLENKCLECDIDVCHACANTVVGKFTELDISEMYDGEYYNSMFCKFFRIVQDVIDSENRRMFLKEKLLTDIENITLLVTNECNLRCTYCVEKGRYKHNTITEDVINSTIDIIKESRKIHSLTLFGGEPLMAQNYQILSYLRDKLIDNDIYIELCIITNGQDLLTNEITQIIQDLMNNNINVRIQISIDNIKSVNDTRRISINGDSAYTKAMNGLVHIGTIIDKKNLSVNSVINYDELDSFFNWCKYLDNLVKINVIGGFSVRYDQLQDKSLSILQQKSFNEFYNKVCDAYIKGVISRQSFKSIMNIKNVSCSDQVIRSDHGCGAGINSITVNTNGDLLICYMLVDEPVGNILDDVIGYESIYNIFDKVQTCGQFRSFGKSCNSCKEFETCVKCKISNLILNKNVRDNNMANCKNVKERNSIMRSYGINLDDFKHLTHDEIVDLISDIKELELIYKSDESLTNDEKDEIIKSVLIMKERLLD